MNYDSPDQKQAQGRIFNMLMRERTGGAGILRHGLATGDPRAIMAGLQLRTQELAGNRDERRISAQSQAAQQLARLNMMGQFGLQGMKQKGEAGENKLDRELKSKLAEVMSRDQMAKFAADLMGKVGMESMRGKSRWELSDKKFQQQQELARANQDFQRKLKFDELRARQMMAQQAAPARMAGQQAGIDTRALSALAHLEPNKLAAVDPNGAFMQAVINRLKQGIPMDAGFEDDEEEF